MNLPSDRTDKVLVQSSGPDPCRVFRTRPVITEQKRLRTGKVPKLLDENRQRTSNPSLERLQAFIVKGCS